ncbi:MAG TPA: cyclic-di-AMP receptor [Candidatus Dormibacteraeota bacterium]|nr:cyclic-di-AMP receptor [Candidatus Dormibacteraeota bacterium]
MKLVIAVVHGDDAAACSDALSDAGFVCTRFNTSGGFLQTGNATIFTGVEDSRVDEVVELLRVHARGRHEYMNPMPPMAEPAEFFVPFPVEVQVGGATVFVVDVERFEKL